jgi:hypothetical protein
MHTVDGKFYQQSTGRQKHSTAMCAFKSRYGLEKTTSKLQVGLSLCTHRSMTRCRQQCTGTSHTQHHSTTHYKMQTLTPTHSTHVPAGCAGGASFSTGASALLFSLSFSFSGALVAFLSPAFALSLGGGGDCDSADTGLLEAPDPCCFGLDWPEPLLPSGLTSVPAFFSSVICVVVC